jgi:XapX domain-containing protein
MRPYLISLVVGLAVGIMYGLIKVRSPAPPAIALVGLLGMLAGEQVVPMVKSCVVRWEARNAPVPAKQPAPAEQGPGDSQDG